MNAPTGTVSEIAWRPTDSDPMQTVTECRVQKDTGIDNENRPPGKRSITLLSAEAWRDVCNELGTQIPWTSRRANLLIEGFPLAEAIGRPIQVGQIRIWIHGETKPCKLMDQQHDGLKTTLVPECRGGVFGQVLGDGIIRVGDTVAYGD